MDFPRYIRLLYARGPRLNPNVVLIYMRGQAVRTTLNENVMARL